MATTRYYASNAASDLSTGADFTKALVSSGQSSGTQACSIAKSATEVSHAYCASGDPANIGGGSVGTYTVVVPFSAINSNLYLSLTLSRTNSTGTAQASSSASAEQQLTATGNYTFTFSNLDLGTFGSTDRLRIAYSFRNASSQARSATIDFGSSHYIDTPWGRNATVAKTLGAATLSSAATRWRKADLSKTLGAATLSSAAVRWRKADLSKTLGSLTLSSAAEVTGEPAEPTARDAYWAAGASTLPEIRTDTTVEWNWAAGVSGPIPVQETQNQNATVSATGQSVTAARGTATVAASASLTLTGQSATASYGTVSVTTGTNASVDVTGQSATSAHGTATVNASAVHTATGQQATTAHGTTTQSGTASVTLTGQQATTDYGAVTVSTGSNATISLTGQGATASSGTATVSASADHTATGQASTSSHGAATASGSASSSVTGQESTAASGSLTVTGSASVTLTGQQVTSASGTVSVIVYNPQDADVSATGLGMVSAVGAVRVEASQFQTNSGGVLVRLFPYFRAPFGINVRGQQARMYHGDPTVRIIPGGPVPTRGSSAKAAANGCRVSASAWATVQPIRKCSTVEFTKPHIRTVRNDLDTIARVLVELID